MIVDSSATIGRPATRAASTSGANTRCTQKLSAIAHRAGRGFGARRRVRAHSRARMCYRATRSTRGYGARAAFRNDLGDISLVTGLVAAAALAVVGLAVATRTFQRESA